MKVRIFCSILLLLCVALSAQTPTSQRSTPLTVGQPQSVGISPTRLERIDQMALKAIANEEIPGLVALVARRGKIFYNKAYGFADIESNVPMRTDHIFRIASQTKAITSVAAMMLWEEGHFELDEPISKYIYPPLKILKFWILLMRALGHTHQFLLRKKSQSGSYLRIALA